jgi:hypothetical protein
MARTLIYVLLLAPVTACTGLDSTQVFAGTQRPVAGTCDPPGQATLTRRGSAITFSPANGTLTLTGTIQATTLTADLTLTGADKGPYRLVFTGQLNGKQIAGTYTTPRCRTEVTLTQTND